VKLRELLAQFVSAREKLEAFNIRDSGDYAEVLIAKALGGSRNVSGVERGFDVLTAEHGRVEVRSRTLPRDGRRETRVRIPSSSCRAASSRPATFATMPRPTLVSARPARRSTATAVTARPTAERITSSRAPSVSVFPAHSGTNACAHRRGRWFARWRSSTKTSLPRTNTLTP